MELKAKIENGQLCFNYHDQREYQKLIEFNEGKEVLIDIKRFQKNRTSQQNKALHLWFTQLADELNSQGLDMRQVIRQEIDIPWTPYLIKENLFRPTMKTVLGYKSTRQLKTGDIDKIFNIISKAISERTGVYLPFPSIESLMDNYK